MALNIFKKIQNLRKNRKGFSLIEISVVILIIGVIIAGISQASDMIDEAALKGARTASRGSRVSRVKDLVLWIDATADGGSLTSAGKQAVDSETVPQLKDMNPRSSSRLTLASPASTNYPTYNSNKVNGLPGLYFTTDDYIKLSDRFDNSTGEYTIYLVYQPNAVPAAGSSHVIFEKRASAASQSDVFPYKFEIETTGSNAFYKLSDSNGSVYGTKKASAGKVNFIRLSRSSAGLLTIVVDDVSASGTASATSVVNSAELIIGAKNTATPASFTNGRIGELIIFERDLYFSSGTTAEALDIEAYLYKKWKLEKDSSKASRCIVTVANALPGATMAVGDNSFSCAVGYALTGAGASCSAAPNLTFNPGTTACTQNSCIVPASYKVTQATFTGTGVTLNCKNGGTNYTGCNCSGAGGASPWTISCTGIPLGSCN